MEGLIMMHIIEVHTPDIHLSFEELSLSSNISPQALLDLIEHDILIPLQGAEPQHWQFNAACVVQAKKATRLHYELEIDLADLALVLNLLDEIEVLKNENMLLKQQLHRFFHHD
jgi:chaperone modulatory protein CbpM